MALTVEELDQMDAQLVAQNALRAVVDRSQHRLVVALSNCAGSAAAVAENRVLRIVGVQLGQHGLGDVFENIYCAVVDGAEPGDGRTFLQAAFRKLEG